MAALPPGLCRAVALRNRMTRSVTTVAAGAPHAALGLPAYVQFTSPIRRYTDLLAHYQAWSRSFDPVIPHPVNLHPVHRLLPPCSPVLGCVGSSQMLSLCICPTFHAVRNCLLPTVVWLNVLPPVWHR